VYPNLKLQLWRSGLRQNRLAQMLGIDQTLLSKIVNGFRNPDEALRVKIAAILDSDEQWLFESVEPRDRTVQSQQPQRPRPTQGSIYGR